VKLYIFYTIVAVGLGILLLTKSARVTVGTYKIAFIVGITSFCIFFLGHSGGQWDFRIGTNAAFGKLLVVPFLLIVTSPFILLLECGLIGYRCFTSWVRYLCMGLAIIAAIFIGILIITPSLRWIMRR